MNKTKLGEEKVVKALKNVTDPELGLDVHTLGLVYDIKMKEGNSVLIKMTLTSPMCPYGVSMIADVKNKLNKEGFKNPEVELVFEPPWEPSEEVKILLGIQ